MSPVKYQSPVWSYLETARVENQRVAPVMEWSVRFGGLGRLVGRAGLVKHVRCNPDWTTESLVPHCSSTYYGQLAWWLLGLT